MTAVVADRAQRRRLSGRRAGWFAVALIPLAVAGLGLFAVGDTAAGVERVPVALVNADQMITQVDEETGDETFVLAGRLLVTELTSPDSAANLDWRLTNTADAAEQLADGQVYAVLTIPEDFSDAIISMQGDSPRQAEITIRTDDAHSYVAGPVADALGNGLVRTFGSEITKNVVTNLLDSIGSSFTEAADGATKLADGADELSSGGADFADGVGQYTDGVAALASGGGELVDGAAGLASGADDLAAGVAKYAAGANQFSAGLGDPVDGLPALVTGTQDYTDGISQLSAALSAAVTTLQADPTDPVALATVEALSGQLATAAAGGDAISQGLAAAVYGVHTDTMDIQGVLEGADGLADGADKLSGGANSFASGMGQYASGVSSFVSGADQLAAGGASLAAGGDKLVDGMSQLADGATELADGMQTGAEALSDSDQNAQLADVVADPVGYSVETDHSIPGTGSALATVLTPYAAWIGALVIFLVIPTFRVRSLASSAPSGRLLAGTLARAGALAGVQAILLTLVLHTVGGVSWTLLPQTLTFLLLLAVVFTLFHTALVAALGRAGLVASFFLIALQFAASGTLIPIEILAPVFGWISPYMPITWASTGLQQILTQGSAALTTGSAIALILFGAASLLFALAALRRTRRTAVLSLLAPA